MTACASSTSFSRTAPIASMSSFIILAARFDMLPRNRSLISSEAPFRARASLFFSMSRRSTWIPLESMRARSSKVNINRLICSHDSRLRSSSAVMNRFSVARSRLLKMSAIISWASRRVERARLVMNSARSVFST